MGGQIGVSSESGSGSSFWFTINFTRSQSQGAANQEIINLKGNRILIVDDNATNRKILTCVLEKYGCQVTSVASGADVMPVLFRGLLTNAPYRLVLLDMQMPGMDGEQTLRIIRQEQSTRNTKVIILSSRGHSDKFQNLTELENSGYLFKPVREPELLTLVTNTFDSKVSAESKFKTAKTSGEFKATRPLTILLAEDNEINQKVTRVLLTRWGHKIDVTSNGLEAYNAARSKEYDLIFLDVQMPKMDGTEASRLIRDFEGNSRHTPIIAMTAHALSGDKQHCLDAGMDDYISKPLDPEKLFQMIEFWMDNKSGTSVFTPQKPETEAVDPLNLPILDADQALPRFSNDWGFFTSSLDELIESLPEKLATFRSLLVEKNADQLSRQAHNLKGVTANFGALQTSTLAKELDECSMAGDFSSSARLIDEIEVAVQNLIAETDLIKKSKKEV
jgi:two-component system sensor histidine kinase/response regulator